MMTIPAMLAATQGACGKSSDVIDTTCLAHPNTSNTISTILSIVFGFAASIAVLMIVIGGLRYITAKGDPNGTAQARNTILYAVIGLVVTMVAYSIVRLVVKGVG